MVSKGYGLTVHDIDWSSPADLEPYEKAHRQEVKEHDGLMHAWWGNYGISAISFAVERCLAGRKAKTKYIKEPVLLKIDEQIKPMSEKELQKQRELFVAKLEVMKTNFELNHPKKQ